jgi:hypothetical protein
MPRSVARLRLLHGAQPENLLAIGMYEAAESLQLAFGTNLANVIDAAPLRSLPPRNHPC